MGPVLMRSLLHDPIMSDAAFGNHRMQAGVWLCEISAALAPLRQKVEKLNAQNDSLPGKLLIFFFFFEFRADAFRIGGGQKQALA